MHLVIKGRDQSENDAVREFVERQVTSKLSRMMKKIRSIQIWIRDINGPRGGKDHVIQLLVRIRPTGKVAIRHRDYDPYAGIITAIDRTIHAIKRTLGRRRSTRMNSYRRNLLNLGIRSKRALKTLDQIV